MNYAPRLIIRPLSEYGSDKRMTKHIIG